MAWSKHCSFEGGSARLMVYRMGYKPEEVSGHEWRVTVEKEVNECCEKWRGASIWRNTVSTFGSTSACSSIGPTYPAFCPECGRKL